VSLLEIRDLNVWFDSGGRTVHAVRGVSVALERGERIALVGESGCGKTTTIMATMGLLPSSATVSGEVLLDGEELLVGGEAGMRHHRWREMAMVFQGAMNSLNPVKTVISQIVAPMQLHGVAEGREARRRAGELLEQVGIPASRGDHYPHELSGGMRQRVCIAMALSCNPKVLLADEPTTALDVMVQAQILQLLVQLSEELDLALVLVTHDLGVVAQTCSRAVVVYAGAVAEAGSVDILYHDSRHPYTRALFRATPDLDQSVRVESIPGSPPRLDRPIDGCPFRPRCALASDICATEPELVRDDDGHRVACHHSDQTPAAAA
jgi:peptide/nickel transport system ATP-binding protein